jgi:phosphoserine/homoserine phosphotransferase
MNIACLDFEGVLVPEIWISVAEKTGIADLRLTTRDIADYDVLMKKRLEVLAANNLTLKDIQKVIEKMKPMEGAKEFLDWLRSEYQVIILTDSFYEFINPLIQKLDRPTVFCHKLVTDKKGKIIAYELRQTDQKRKSVEALRALNFKVISAGDSYNDLGMLEAADTGIWFKAPDNIVKQFPQFKTAKNYSELKKQFTEFK